MLFGWASIIAGPLASAAPSIIWFHLLEQLEIIRDYLAEECSKGRVLGPLPQAMFPGTHTSSFGVILKGSSG